MKILFLLFFFVTCIQADIIKDGNFLNPIGKLQAENIEIATYLPAAKKVFAIGGSTLYELNIANPENPKIFKQTKLPWNASSIAASKNKLAIAFPGNFKEGILRLYSFTDSLILEQEIKTCSGLDMVTFSPNGNFLLGACEGSPSDDFSEDPEGGVLYLSLENSKNTPEFLSFNHLDSARLISLGVRKIGESSFFNSLEPEYITIASDSKTAWVSLQENNALAKIDLSKKQITDVFPLGVLDHSKDSNTIVISSSEEITRTKLPLLGIRGPDGIASFSFGNKSFVLTANEGADVDYSAWKDSQKWEKRLKGEKLDSAYFHAEPFKNSKIKLAKDPCLKNELGECSAFYSFGTRSISLFDGNNGKLLWDSGNLLERKMEKLAKPYFNWNSKKGKVKVNARSSSKGIEPENVVIGDIENKKYAFIGLERMSGIVVFELENGKNPQYKGFFWDSSDRGPEGMFFIPAENSPTKEPLLIVCYEYSGTFVIYRISQK